MTLQAELVSDGNAPVSLTHVEKRALIAAELRNDPNRSDREIGRIVGCDHKTVAAARKETPEETPTNRRHMLINGAADFMSRYPDQSNGKTPEQAIDDAIAKGIVSLAPKQHVDRPDDHWVNDNPDLLFWDQPATVCYWNQLDQVVIKQKADPYEESDPYLRFAPENLPKLIERLEAIHAEWEASR